MAFRGEEALGHELFTRLDGGQRERAVIADTLPSELFVGAFRDNFELDRRGLRLSEMSPGQRETARRLLGLYVNRAYDQHARVRMEEVLTHEGDTHFGWVGDPDGTFYYRFHSPVILVEFEHMPGVLFDNDYPSRLRHPHGRPHPQRQRLRRRPAAPPPRAAPQRISGHDGHRYP